MGLAVGELRRRLQGHALEMPVEMELVVEEFPVDEPMNKAILKRMEDQSKEAHNWKGIKMRNRVSGILLIGFLGVVGCGSSQVADPEGTVDLTINYMSASTGMTLVLWNGTDEDPLKDSSGGPLVSYSQVQMGIRDTSMNFSFQAIGWMYKGGVAEANDPTGGEIVDVGEVGGLGDVVEKPTLGWISLCAVEVRHGYVARFRHSINYGDTSLPYFYARLYVTGWLLDTSDGMIGAKVKYQLPF